MSILIVVAIAQAEETKAPTAEDTHPVAAPATPPVVPPVPEGPFTAFRVGYSLKEGKDPIEKCIGFEIEVGSERQADRIRSQKYVKDFGAMFCATLSHVCKKCEPLVVRVAPVKK